MASNPGGMDENDAVRPGTVHNANIAAEYEQNSVDQDEDPKHDTNDDDEEEEEEDEEEAEEDDEDEEPKLKYASLTKAQGAIYRNGDAASAFLVAGDKMIIGTHNGYVHVLSLPSFRSLRAYHAHSASVSTVTVSPFPPPLPSARADVSSRTTTEGSPVRLASQHNVSNKDHKQQTHIPNSPENSIHIATSSIDGNVCIFSLLDSKDVLLRNFGRPVQAVSLSPNYKTDRSYLSGGLAGSLILTVGGKAGATANANTSGASAAAAGWLNTIGLGGSNGTDAILHSGEGIISTIKWSLSGKYIVWINEQGIKIMRSNLHLEGNEVDFSWKRMSHIDRPTRAGWEEMAGVWKARAEWVDEDGLESDDPYLSSSSILYANPVSTDGQSIHSMQSAQKNEKSNRRERLLVGWGGSIWIIDVHPGGTGVGTEVGERKIGHVDIVAILRTDCIISGVSLYTPNLLVVLAYVTPDKDNSLNAKQLNENSRRGMKRRQNAVQPEIRIININTKEEVCVADTLIVSRFESLSATDYHLGVLPVMKSSTKAITNRGAFEVIGGVGGTIWDAAMYSTKLFSSAASVVSTGSAGDSVSGSQLVPSDSSTTPFRNGQGPHPALLTRGMKIFIQSPYDCVLATKLTFPDHLAWLYEHSVFEEAWKVLEIHPEAAEGLTDKVFESIPGTPTRSQNALSQTTIVQPSLIDFFADDSSQTTASGSRKPNSQIEKAKRRVGQKWLQQLIHQDHWHKAGEVCSLVLSNATDWDHWVWVFVDANKHEEITPYVPTVALRPPISSTIYEVLLGHYLSNDILKFSELVDKWPPELYEVGSVVSVVESKVRGTALDESTSDSTIVTERRLLLDTLAKLYLANGQARNALICYIKVQDADAAMSLIASHHLIDAVADDIPGLILLRVSKEQQKTASISELEEASLEPIRLLVSETYQGTVHPENVFQQLKDRKNMQIYQFFYLRALWTGDALDTADSRHSERRSRRDAMKNLMATEGKSIVNDSADLALALFAEFDRDLLFRFLRVSQSYTLSRATSICEKRDYIPELVYLLAKEGQTKRALRIIINKLDDVSQAIAFAKEQDDADLWDDLLNLSMKKPAFIRALLEEVGTSIDPITLVRRIPEGLEIVGLRDALTRMIKGYELQDSISKGVARVFRGEVSAGMAVLREGQKKGIRFDILIERSNQIGTKSEEPNHKHRVGLENIKDGQCFICGGLLFKEVTGSLIAFPCGHTFHLDCFLRFKPSPPISPNPRSPSSVATDKDPAYLTTFPSLEDSTLFDPSEDPHNNADQGIGPKVQFAKDLLDQGRLARGQGCPLEVHANSR